MKGGADRGTVSRKRVMTANLPTAMPGAGRDQPCDISMTANAAGR